jgi:DNA replication and repair protein RecF
VVDALAGQLAGDDDAQFPAAELAIEGWQPGDLSAELAAGRARDAAAGRALAGPHRQDLIVTHRAKGQAAALCSTGEQKALLLGIVLAHAALVAARGGIRPVLLLDEVAAHLDPPRRAALFERLEGRGQIWMTGTERAPFADLGAASWFTVAEGQICTG